MSSRALLVVVVVLLAGILGYMVYRDRMAAIATKESIEAQEAEDRREQIATAEGDLRKLKLRVFERKFGREQRLRLEAYVMAVRANGVEGACVSLSGDPRYPIPAAACDAYAKNYGALLSVFDIEFVKPPAAKDSK